MLELGDGSLGHLEPAGQLHLADRLGPAELIEADLLERLPSGYPTDTLLGGYEIDVPIADMSVYLPYLMERLRQLGVSISDAEIASFDDLRARYPADVYVNCTGLGARDLTGDTELSGVKGQIIRVNGAAVPTHIADDHSASGMTYVLRRKEDITLGGTEQQGIEDSIVDPTPTRSWSDALRLSLGWVVPRC